ncbi:hypothetical protein SBOR_8390 [Sclerotinia borealis F-4128]|uniref:C2H2-type domain-containing protein n=1 Tax=Sclerotinia borealis (strain F-4128) TaxID=1432307 RepID=W9C5R0_SCLBF|nr:hypothetical protein SBOR_8390 [Sclerotinia borealis F-4128]
MVHSHNPQTTTASLGRSIVAPPIMPMNSFGGNPFNMMNGHQKIPQNPYSFTSYTDGSSTATYGANYIQPRPFPRMMQSFSHSQREAHYNGSNHQGFIESTPHHQSPPIKPEPLWTTPANRQLPPQSQTTPPPSKTITPLPPTGSDEAHIGSTAVDRLMKVIQDITKTSQSQSPSDIQDSMNQSFFAHDEEDKHMLTSGKAQDKSRRSKTAKNIYRCTFPNCTSSSAQRSQLVIHFRKHTGDKPYPCEHPSCGLYFSQPGNLKTHEQRHTGERRFQCEICKKRFGQRSNLSAHKIVHTGIKPYPCKIDNCHKSFTQRGNLKAHHNKFHKETIETLVSKLQSGEIDLEANKEFWSYFFTLYKNSNKGIKGRGKDRNISPSSRSCKNRLASRGSSASRYVESGLRNCHGMYDSDDRLSLRSEVMGMSGVMSGGVSVDGNFCSVSTDGMGMGMEMGTSSSCSSTSENGSVNGNGNVNWNANRGLVFRDRLY